MRNFQVSRGDVITFDYDGERRNGVVNYIKRARTTRNVIFNILDTDEKDYRSYRLGKMKNIVATLSRP